MSRRFVSTIAAATLVVLVLILASGCGLFRRATPSPTPFPEPPSPAAPTAEPSPTPTITLPAPSPRPPEETPAGPTPLPPPVPKPGYGIQAHLLAGDMEETLRWAQGLGVGWVKQQVEWHTIEHGPGDLDWALLDMAVDACNRYGFKLLLGVAHAPDWTRASELEGGPPADFVEFARFMEQLAARYRGRVAAYELWNEPNLAREWQGDTLSAARFVALVAEGARGVRAGDPDALVISGAPGVTGYNDGVTAIDDRVFMRGMYEAGIARWVDGIGVHPYGFANPPDESWQDAAHVATGYNNHPSFFFRDTLEDYHAIMLEFGDTKRQLWATEFGWPSTHRMGQMDAMGWEYAREVKERHQAEYIVRAFRMGEEREWVGTMFLWNLNEAPIWGPGNPTSAYSLLRPDGSYREAYIGLRLAEPLR